MLFTLFLSLVICAQAEDKKANDHEAVSIALSSLLMANKNGEWEKLFMIHSNDGQKIILDEAFVRLSIMARNEIPASQAAKDVMRRYFNKDAAEKEINKSKVPLSRREQQLVLLRHIFVPEKLYSEWRVIEEDYDERNVIRELRNNVEKTAIS